MLYAMLAASATLISGPGRSSTEARRLARLFRAQQKWARVALGGSPGRRW